MKSTATFTFESALYTHGSWGSRNIEGTHACTMEFFEADNAGHACIEWYAPSLDMSESIGLTFEMREGKRTLTDYDGIFALPAQAVSVLQQLGIVVPRGDGMDEEIDAAAALEGDELPAQAVRCPDTERHPNDVVGCGQTFRAEPDKEGLYDCPHCGIHFKLPEGA
jgi:hypothetical protein